MMTPNTPSRWLHAWAVLTTALVFVQLALGSVVTTFQVGMADPQWPTAPWYLAQVHLGSLDLGKLIEHTHRMFGSLVGLAVIVLAVWLWLGEPRRILRWVAILALLLPMVLTLFLGMIVVKQPWAWLFCLGICVLAPVAVLPLAFDADKSRRVRWLGTLALSGVIMQGLLGGFRVFWHTSMGPELSIVHGVLAQVYLAFLACLTLMTARDCGLRMSTPVSLRSHALLLPALVLGQLVLGAMLRHTLSPLWQRLHLIAAFVVVLTAAALVAQLFRHRAGDARAKRLAVVLAVLVGVQVIVGVEAFALRFASGKPPETVMVTVGQAVVRTIHVLGGALILTTAAATAVWLRSTSPAPEVEPESAPEPVRELEGVA